MKTNNKDNSAFSRLSTLHESPSLRAVTGPFLRPGGLALTERGLSLCGFTEDALIIDVGCGTGASVSYLRDSRHFRALGVNLSAGRFQRNEDGFPAVVARSEELPLAKECCDGILCECVLSLVAEPERALREFSRVLRTGGFLIMSDIYNRGEESLVPDVSEKSAGCASALRSRPFIETLLDKSGLGLVAWEDHSRRLKELAAQLILSSDSPTDFCGLFRSMETSWASQSGPRISRPGYFLLVAKKIDEGETCYG